MLNAALDLLSPLHIHLHWPTVLWTVLTLVALRLARGWLKDIIPALWSVLSSTSLPGRRSAAVSLTVVQISSLLAFLHTCGRLKRTVRTGWRNMQVSQPETVAEHSYRLACMAASFYFLQACDTCHPGSHADQGETLGIVLWRALVHDLAEAIVGDITPTAFSGITKAHKAEQEAAAMQTIRALALPFSSGLAQQTQQAFDDYEHNRTRTSLLLHDLDKLEMILQAYEYEYEELQSFNFNKDRTLQFQRESWENKLDAANVLEPLNENEQLQCDRLANQFLTRNLGRFYESKHKINDTNVRLVAEQICHRRAAMLQFVNDMES